MLWVLLTLLGAIFSSATSILDKAVLGNEMKDPILATVIAGFTNFLIFFLAAIILNGLKSFNTSITVIILSLLSGIIFVMVGMMYYFLLQDHEVSRTIPTLTLSTVVVAILSYFILGEIFNLLTYLGIFFLILGTIIISIKKSSKKTNIGLSFFILLAIMLLLGLRTIMVKVGIQLSDLWSVLLYFGIGAGVFSGIFLAIHHPKITQKVKNGTFHFFLVDILGTLSRLLIIAALAMGPATLVISLSYVNNLFTFLVATILAQFHPNFLHEVTNKKIFLQKTIAIVLIILGAIIIS